MTDPRITNVEFLLMLAEDIKAEGDDLADEMRQRGIAHAKRIEQLSALLNQARDVVDREGRRFAQYITAVRKPNEIESTQQPLPKVAMKGPRE